MRLLNSEAFKMRVRTRSSQKDLFFNKSKLIILMLLFKLDVSVVWKKNACLCFVDLLIYIFSASWQVKYRVYLNYKCPGYGTPLTNSASKVNYMNLSSLSYHKLPILFLYKMPEYIIFKRGVLYLYIIKFHKCLLCNLPIIILKIHMSIKIF